MRDKKAEASPDDPDCYSMVQELALVDAPQIIAQHLNSMDGDWMSDARKGTTALLDNIIRLPGNKYIQIVSLLLSNISGRIVIVFEQAPLANFCERTGPMLLLWDTNPSLKRLQPKRQCRMQRQTIQIITLLDTTIAAAPTRLRSRAS